MKQEPNTHDYSKRGWGHDYTFNPTCPKGLTATMMGWGHGLKPDDYLILQDGTTRTTRYQIVTVEYYRDPPDMWRATVKFAPRTSPKTNETNEHVQNIN